MTDPTNQHGQLVELFITTAQAHHKATGGVNPQWAEWYAARMLDDLNELMATSMTVEQLTAWLVNADRTYNTEPQAESWPKAYAHWMLSVDE